MRESDINDIIHDIIKFVNVIREMKADNLEVEQKNTLCIIMIELMKMRQLLLEAIEDCNNI